MTNGDRIRSMRDEELLQFLSTDSCSSCPAKKACKHGYMGEDNCKRVLQKWLKQESMG